MLKFSPKLPKINLLFIHNYEPNTTGLLKNTPSTTCCWRQTRDRLNDTDSSTVLSSLGPYLMSPCSDSPRMEFFLTLAVLAHSDYGFLNPNMQPLHHWMTIFLSFLTFPSSNNDRNISPPSSSVTSSVL